MGLLDDVMKNINNGINEIQSKSQEVMQSISINNRITSLEAKKTALLTNIGQLVYDKFEKGDEVSDELLKEKAKEVTLIEKDIELARAELQSIKLEPDAPRSQKAAHQAGYKPTPGFNCPHCGAAANSGKMYCVACGGSLKEAAATAAGSSQQSNFNPNGSNGHEGTSD